MDVGDDIIDVLYKYRDSPRSGTSSKSQFEDPFDNEESHYFSEYGTLDSEHEYYGSTAGDERTYEYFPRRRSVRADVISRSDNEDFYFESYKPDDEDIITLPNGVRRRRQKFEEEEGIIEENDEDDCVREAPSSSFPISSHRDKLVYDRLEASINFSSHYECKAKVMSISRRDAILGGNRALGIAVMLFIAYKYGGYLELLHENQTWFSNVGQLDREISFRTEQGLYYSYFKEFVAAPSVSEGLRRLKFDNTTEHSKTVNIIHRFNIHQEIMLGLIYKLYNFNLEPIFFYVQAIFTLQGLLIMAFYLISWRMSGTWVSGVLTSAYVICHRNSVTRVDYTLALREHFSLPFIFLQFGAIGYYLQKRQRNISEKLDLIIIYSLTLLFTLTWQFAQFVLLLESLTLFGLATLRIADKDKVCKIFFLNGLAVISVWYLQYYQPMVMSSLVLCFIPVAIIYLQTQSVSVIQPGHLDMSFVSYLFTTGWRILSACLISLILNIGLKFFLDQNDDNHILHFIKSKFGFSDETNFETRLYLCLSAFQALPLSALMPFISTGALPLYSLSLLLSLISIILTTRKDFETSVHKKKDDDNSETDVKEPLTKLIDGSESFTFLCNASDRPEILFHMCMSLVLGVLALSTFRMKCFWSPYIIIGASAFVCDFTLLKGLVSIVLGRRSEHSVNFTQFTRHLILVFITFHLYQSHKNVITDELEDLRELHDPNTVDLMQWIIQSTPSKSAFAGSMQLLAGVKLCTMRHVTNHPHFEDKDLRQRTKEIYSIYSKMSPESVYKTLRKYDTNYIILEDSICMSKSPNRCSLPDTMDLTRGFIPDDGIHDPPHLIHSSYPRFCDEIRYKQEPYTKFFKEVFSNPTFRVYELKT